MAFLSSLFGTANPAREAQKYLSQVPETIKPYYQPYVSAGRQTLSDLLGQYGQLTSSPQDVLSKFGEGYQQSPGYQYLVDQMTKASNQAAAAGGMVGSPSQQTQISQDIGNIANKYYDNYLNKVLGLYGTGLGGEEAINQMGYGASSDLAQSLMSQLLSEANLGYAGAINQNQSRQGLMGYISGALSGGGFNQNNRLGF